MRSNRLAMSAAWAFTSCTQIQSGRVAAIQLSTPLLVAERMPLRLRLVNLNKEFPMVDVGAQTSEQGQLAQDFVRFAVESGVLRFGEFKTKAGRLSPYFFNAGLFDDGRKIGRLAEFYAKALLASGIEFDMVFGPAYKGIPLAATVAVELAPRGGAGAPPPPPGAPPAGAGGAAARPGGAPIAPPPHTRRGPRPPGGGATWRPR